MVIPFFFALPYKTYKKNKCFIVHGSRFFSRVIVIYNMLLIFDLFGPLWIFIMNQYKQTFYRSFFFSPQWGKCSKLAENTFYKEIVKTAFCYIRHY